MTVIKRNSFFSCDHVELTFCRGSSSRRRKRRNWRKSQSFTRLMLQTISNSFASKTFFGIWFLVAGLIMMMRNVCEDKVRFFFVCAVCLLRRHYLVSPKEKSKWSFDFSPVAKHEEERYGWVAELVVGSISGCRPLSLSLPHTPGGVQSNRRKWNGRHRQRERKKHFLFASLQFNNHQRACIFYNGRWLMLNVLYM